MAININEGYDYLHAHESKANKLSRVEKELG